MTSFLLSFQKFRTTHEKNITLKENEENANSVLQIQPQELPTMIFIIISTLVLLPTNDLDIDFFAKLSATTRTPAIHNKIYRQILNRDMYEIKNGMASTFMP